MSSIDDSIGVVYGDHGNESRIGETIMQSDKTPEIDNGKDRKYRKENEDQEKQSPTKKKRHHLTYKYSNRGKGVLHEAVTIGGLPFFLIYDNGRFKVLKKIIEDWENSNTAIF